MKFFRKTWKYFWNFILSHSIAQWILAFLMFLIIWFIYFTSIKKIKGKDILKKFKNKNVIFVFWHGRTMMLSPIVYIFGFRGYAVASRHKDGKIMAKLQRFFGLKSILGSSSEGGFSALRQGVRVLRKKSNVLCLSPDGPSGPSLRFHDGALYFARMSGFPLIPVCFSSSPAWFQKRWDRYLISLPFSRINYDIGEPIYLDQKEDLNYQKEKMENILINQLRKMDKEFNLFEVESDLTATEFKKNRRK